VGGFPLLRKRTICALQYHDHRYVEVNQLGGDRKSIVLAVCPSVFDLHVLTFMYPGDHCENGKILASIFKRATEELCGYDEVRL
jgi:hypothetical protein